MLIQERKTRLLGLFDVYGNQRIMKLNSKIFKIYCNGFHKKVGIHSRNFCKCKVTFYIQGPYLPSVKARNLLKYLFHRLNLNRIVRLFLGCYVSGSKNFHTIYWLRRGCKYNISSNINRQGFLSTTPSMIHEPAVFFESPSIIFAILYST